MSIEPMSFPAIRPVLPAAQRAPRLICASGRLKGCAALALAAASALLALNGRAAAQQGQAMLPPAALDPSMKQAQGGVSVGDSIEALKELDTAYNMERQHDWVKAADWYQEVLQKYSQKLVPVATDPTSHYITSYASVPQRVRQAMARWPKEGIDAYRDHYEAAAASLLQQAGPEDAAALSHIMSTYFITESSKTAGLRLIDLYIESGEFPAAAWVGDLLLTSYPQDGLIVDRPRILQRTALAYHLCGNEKAAQAWRNDLRQNYPNAAGALFGKDVILADALDQELASAPPVASTLGGDSWPTVGGGFDRSRVPDAKGRANARFYAYELSKPTYPKTHSAPEARALENQEQSLRKSGQTLGIMPVTDSGALYFQDGSHVYAISLDSGVPLSGWAQEHPGEKPGVFSIAVTGPANTQPNALTLTNHCVLAVMGAPDRGAMVGGFNPMMQGARGATAPGADGTHLVCLDRDNGRLLWEVTPGTSFKEENLRSLDLCGAPVVVGDSVYLVGHGGKDPQFESCFVLCLDLANGNLRWSCFVAGASSPVMFGGGGENESLAAASHLAYSSGRIYVCSNLGALAALDAYSGTIDWLSLYARDNDASPEAMAMAMRFGRRGPMNSGASEPWDVNPIILEDGRLFSVPSDGKCLLINDAGTGVEIKRVPLDDANKGLNLGKSIMLLAVDGPYVFLCGERAPYCFNWKEYTGGPGAAALAWAGSVGSPVRGRGFVTTDSVFIPSEDGLSRFDRKSGRVAEIYPKGGGRQRPTWDESEGPGNILVTADHVVIAGASTVNVFTDLAMAPKKLDLGVENAPDDAAPRLRYAEVMFAAGQLPLTFEKLNDAMRLMGGKDHLQPGPARETLYTDTLLWAEKAAKNAGKDSISLNSDVAAQFYDIAQVAAGGPSEQVHYRMSRAKFARDAGNPGQAVTLYQQILSDPDLRTVPLAEESDSVNASFMHAAAAAERAITEVCAGHPEVYKPIEMQAAAAFDAARQTNNAATLLDVAQIYPNASVAPQAMLAASQAYEKGGNPRLATHVLVQIYRKYSDTAHDNQQVIEAMARNYLSAADDANAADAARAPATAPAVEAPQFNDNVAIALRRLQKAAREFGSARLAQPLKLPDGTTLENVTFTQAMDAVQKLGHVMPAQSLPDYHVAKPRRGNGFLPEDPASIIPGVTALLLPPPALRELSRHDRIVAASDAKLSIYAAGHTQPIASCAPLTSPPHAIAWSGNKLFAWNNQEVGLVNGDNGSVRWHIDLKSVPAIEVVNATDASGVTAVNDSDSDPGAANRNNGRFIVQGNQQIFINANGAMRVMVPAAAVAAPTEEQVSEIRPLADRVLVSTTGGRVICINLSDGKLLWQTRLSRLPINRLLANEDFSVVRLGDASAAQIIALDNYTGQVEMRRNFSTDSGMLPVNLALAPDGLLVWVTPDRMCGKDLYEPGDTLKFDTSKNPQPGAGANAPMINAQSLPFAYCANPDQLIISNGRIIVLEQEARWACIYSAETGAADPKGGAPLTTRAGQGDHKEVSLHVDHDRMYIAGPRSLISYKIDKPSADYSWLGNMPDTPTPVIRDCFMGSDVLILLDEPGSTGKPVAPATSYHLLSYSRALDKSTPPHESGLCSHDTTVVEPAGITQWQAADGGLYYLAGDNKLHFMAGSRP